MSSPFGSLRKSTRASNPSGWSFRRTSLVIQINLSELESANAIIMNAKQPEETVDVEHQALSDISEGLEMASLGDIGNPEAVYTDSANFPIRFERIKLTLGHLTNNFNDIILKPMLFLNDFKLIRYTCSTKHSVSRDTVSTAMSWLLDNGITDAVISYWKQLNISIGGWQKEHLDHLELLYHLLMAIWFISAEDAYRQQVFLQLGDFLLVLCRSPAFSESLPRAFRRQADCLKAILGIIYQFAVHIEGASEFIKDREGQKAMNNIIKQRFTKNVKVRATLILSYILSEQEQLQLKTTQGLIDLLLSILQSCCVEENHRSKSYNYSALEILEGLNQLAICDGNKQFVSRGLNSYKLLLGDASTTEEQQAACKGIWTLSFDEQIKAQLQQDMPCISALQNLAKSPIESLSMAAGGALWTLEERDSLKAVHSREAHIMLSYNWSVQKDVLALKLALQEKGYRVWMDVDNMRGSTLAAMSQAVEQATVVLILFSERYKQSQACRAEAEYAYKLQKEFIPVRMQTRYSPDGWLGMLIGTKLFYDLSIPDRWQQTIDQIIEQLQERGKGPPIDYGSEGKAACDDTADHNTNQDTGISKKSLGTDASLANWSAVQLNSWSKANNLDHVLSRLGTVSAMDLAEMKVLLHSAPAVFFSLTRELAVPLPEALRLSHSLRKLR